MANINTETLAQFYGVLLYKKKDIVAIQKQREKSIKRQAKRKLGMLPLVTIGGILEGPGNANKLEVPSDSELTAWGKHLLIHTNLEYQSNEASTDISLGEIFNLLMYLEENIIAIREELNIVGYTNQEMAEEGKRLIKLQENISE
ncbi:hypothetical protein RhiirA4_484571 [Rhizophagus irregularis]|uniref:Uncharacterized protein n=1 Tax=Rhizophagus irregularis TaxID=588596 RepID=A0A2I1HP37_9GLOM|nr:hypothetical protein RhiirA4_484571 [Rhizophagus irregularis]